MTPRCSPLTLSPVAVTSLPADSFLLPTRSPGFPPAVNMVSTPHPTQLFPASKIQRIDVWRTEVGLSDIVCVCSLRTATGPSVPLLLAARSPMIHPPSASVPLANTISAQSQPQHSPASSVYSSSDVYSSTQATSPLSSNSLGFMLDEKLDLCPQCGVRRNDPTSPTESEVGIAEGEFKPQKQVVGHGSKAPKKKRLWTGVKKLARKYIVRDLHQKPPAVVRDTRENNEGKFGPVVSRNISRLSVPGFTTPPPPAAAAKDPSQPRQEYPEQPNPKRRVSQTLKRMSLHLGSPLQSAAPPYCSTTALVPPAASVTNRPSADNSRLTNPSGVAGTQMYRSLRYATADDERLMEILGTTKFASASPIGRHQDATVDIDVDIEELSKEDNESPEARRLRERAERLERGRRLLSKNSGVVTAKRPISFAGVPVVGMGAKF